MRFDACVEVSDDHVMTRCLKCWKQPNPYDDYRMWRNQLDSQVEDMPARGIGRSNVKIAAHDNDMVEKDALLMVPGAKI